MKLKTMSYYSYGSEKYPGVLKKINNTVKAARTIGFSAEHKAFRSRDRLVSIKELFFDKADVIFIRFAFLMQSILFPLLIYKRLTGHKIIVDVPTPRAVAVNEMRGKKSENVKLKIIWNYIFSSWILFPANRIVQYADESKYFSFGLNHKTLKLGNGILIDSSVSLVEQVRKSNELNLIGVASLAFWHGYDRLIKAIALFNKEYPEYKINFKVVGDGEVLTDLKGLVEKLNLTDSVTFTGALYGGDLERAYIGMNVSVSSLGLFRKGLDEASDLKTREYLAKGLCVLGSGKDPDFTTENKFRFTVPNDATIEPIVAVLLKLMQVDLPKPEEVRAYALENLSLERKLVKILSNL